MRPIFLVALSALFLAAGCVPAWVNPTRDDAATLTFVPEATGYVHAYLFVNGKDCTNETRISGFGGLSGKTEIKVPPGEELAPSISIAAGNWNCSLLMSFVPQPRQAYVAHITGSSMKCKMGIGRVDGTKIVPEPSARPRKWTGSRCE